MIRIINGLGEMIGWSRVTVHVLGRNLVGIRKIAYNDETERENEYGAGNMPIGQSEGRYKAEASIELTLEEAHAIQQALPVGGRLQDIPPFDIIVQYQRQNRIITDRIRNCRFMGRGVEVSEGDKTIAQDYTLLVSHIEWDV